MPRKWTGLNLAVSIMMAFLGYCVVMPYVLLVVILWLGVTAYDCPISLPPSLVIPPGSPPAFSSSHFQLACFRSFSPATCSESQ
jgi:hypothetical protein